MVRFTSSVVLALSPMTVAVAVSGCRGSAASPPPTPELNVAPMPSGVFSAAPTSSESTSTNTTARAETDTDSQVPESERPQGDTCGLVASIRSVAGQGMRFSVTLTNNGAKPVRLVMPGDGSEAGMRTPVLTWMATAGGKPAEPAPVGRCGLTNAMEAKEVFTLAPGASREMKEWLGEPYVAAGTYDVKLRFRNDPKIVRNASPDVTKLVAATDACDVTSNAIRVTIQAP